jgi:AraC family transcriptional regulator, regulatory protein of adaptative response / methylated-DNA-[protein]-cysteine methyltransferase
MPVPQNSRHKPGCGDRVASRAISSDLKARAGVRQTDGMAYWQHQRTPKWMMTMTIQKNSKAASTLVADDPRWTQIVARDRSADGQFWYSVATTGIYCRPSCPSRAANPKNVQLHDTLEDAKATGFRPCKRWNPDGLSVDAENAALVAKACRLIENSDEEPGLNDLASAVERSPSHFHRLFKATTGLTPKD